MKYQIWDGQSPVKCPLKSFTKEEFLQGFPFAKDQKVLLGMQGDTAVEVSNLNIVTGNFDIDTTDMSDNEIILAITEKINAEKIAQLEAIKQEQFEKQELLNDQYLRDCNNELSVLAMLPDVEPLSEPVVEDTRYLNYKWNYDNGYWNKTALKLTVRKGMISREEYQAIVGEVYK